MGLGRGGGGCIAWVGVGVQMEFIRLREPFGISSVLSIYIIICTMLLLNVDVSIECVVAMYLLNVNRTTSCIFRQFHTNATQQNIIHVECICLPPCLYSV